MSDTPLLDAYARYKADLCSWTEVQAVQARLMPRCAEHGTPTGATIHGKPVCARCVTEAGAALKRWLSEESHTERKEA